MGHTMSAVPSGQRVCGGNSQQAMSELHEADEADVTEDRTEDWMCVKAFIN